MFCGNNRIWGSSKTNIINFFIILRFKINKKVNICYRRNYLVITYYGRKSSKVTYIYRKLDYDEH